MKTRIIKRKGTLLSSVAMLSTAMLLTACGGDGGDSPVDDGGANPGESGAQALLYAYPDNGQNEISTAAPVVLRFSSAVNLGEAQNSITVYEGDAQTGTVVAVTPESVAGEPNNVLLQPDEDLKPNQTYTVVIEDLRLRKGTAKDQTLTFTTRPLHEGPKNLVVKDDTFEVSRRMPDGSAMEPVMDFSSFRFQFTQPIDRATANYGEDPASTGPGGGAIPADSVVLRDSTGAPVPATLLIDGAYMTVDPDQDYLNAGETYTLDITADLASTYGETFGAQSYTLTPKDSSPKGEPAILVQKLTQGSTSRLTGKPVNEVPVNGTLLGENKNITQASAEVVRAELADVTTYTDVTPIRLPKGTVLNGAEINPILIGGEVPAGFGSGDVTMTVLSDASGYLVPNPYAENNPDALRIVHLLMDVGIATSEPRANGAFTQDLLHIELVGLAEVDPTAGVLNLDAVSVVEPNILGQEYGYGMLSFQLQSYKDQNSAPENQQDSLPPTLQSWTMGTYRDPATMEVQEKSNVYKQGESIALNFDEPIDPASVTGQVLLYENGQAVDSNVYVDGASLIVEPAILLKNNKEDHAFNYQLQIGSGLTDVAGNNVDPIVKEFSLPKIVVNNVNETSGGTPGQTEQRSPIPLSAYPGFPCVLTETDLSQGDAGRCLGSFPGWDQGVPKYDIKPEDDHMPVQVLPANRPIIVQFSKAIDKDTLIVNNNFIVQRIDADENVLEEVPGSIQVNGPMVSFQPASSWKEGELYRYILKAGGTTSSFLCDGSDGICGIDGLPIQTRILSELSITSVVPSSQENIVRDYVFSSEAVAADSGGPDLIQYFRGGIASHNVIQVLSSAPAYDANHNFIHEQNAYSDGGETPVLSVTPAVNQYSYNLEERGAGNQPLDMYADPDLDPNGLVPPPNSAKILSKDRLGEPGTNRSAPAVNGVNFGCGYAEAEFVNPSIPFLGATKTKALECPDRKFTYLTASLVAEVTDKVDEEKGMRVLIWPGQIMSTSVRLQTQVGNLPFVALAESGAQILRMRYAESDSSADSIRRNKPIEGWIDTDSDGNLSLSAEVDLYMDGIELNQKLPYNNPSHTLFSHPITMNLSGSVDFLDDGRMMVEQYNLNPVDVDIYLSDNQGIDAGTIQIRIPSHGNRLMFISEAIK